MKSLLHPKPISYLCGFRLHNLCWFVSKIQHIASDIRTLNISNTLLQDLLKNLWVFKLLLDLRNNAL